MDVIPTDSSLLLYQTDDGQTKIEVCLQGETVWLTQAQMAELFDKDRRTIGEHIQNIFTENELEENSVCRKFRHTASEIIYSRANAEKTNMGLISWAGKNPRKSDVEIAKNYLNEEVLTRYL